MYLKSITAIILSFYLHTAISETLSPWGDATLQIFDILEQNSSGLDLILDGDTAYLAAAFGGLYILDTSDLNDIKVKYQFKNTDFGIGPFSLYSIVKHGNYLYCGFRTSTLSDLQGYVKVVNLANLGTANPVVETNDVYFDGNTIELGFRKGGRVSGLYLDETTDELYVALTLGGLSVIDVSNPTTPLLKGGIDVLNTENQQVIVDKSHQRAYFGSWGRGIGTVDISDADPNNWTQILTDDASASDRFWYMEQRDQYLYAPVADSPSDNTFDEGLAIYDLTGNFSDATVDPVRIGFAALPSEHQCESASGGKDAGLVGGDPGPHQILLNNNYAIVGNGCAGIAIFDISDAYNPFFIKAYEIPGQVDWPWSVVLSGNKLITVGRNKNFSVNNDVYVFTIAPINFEFSDVTDVTRNSTVHSEAVTLNGLGIATEISILDGKYSINSGTFTDIPGLINNGDAVRVMLETSSEYSTTTTATIVMGGASDTFSSTTLADPADTSAMSIEPENSDTKSSTLNFLFLALFIFIKRLRSLSNNQIKLLRKL